MAQGMTDARGFKTYTDEPPEPAQFTATDRPIRTGFQRAESKKLARRLKPV